MRRRTPLVALLAADAVSNTGNTIARIAIPWLVLEATGSAALTGLTAFFSFLPVVISAFFGGALVDRFGFRRTSVVADVASALAVAAIPVVDALSGIEVWQVMALVFVGALLDAPGVTAREALLPDLAELGGMRIERAAGLHGAIARGSVLIGAPLGGVLVAVVGSTTALWLDAASFAVSAVVIRGLVPALRPHAHAEDEPSRYLAQLAEGVRYVAADRLLRAIVVTVLLTNFLDAPIAPVVYPVLVREAFGGPEYLGLMLGTFGGAAFVGSLAFGAVGHRLPRRAVFVGCFFTWAVMLLAISTLPPLPVALVAIAVGGFAAGPLNPVLGAVQYERIPARLRGRVFGAVTAAAWAAIPLGTILGGVAVQTLGVQTTLVVIGVAYVAVTAYGFFNDAFREMDDPEPVLQTA
ncbi:MAG TPA: MFS transporter [Gaiellaceae bacterium]|nr:MFS transporter [Gaiellaceae bacterium]